MVATRLKKSGNSGLGRERMSDDLMELNDMELNYIGFGGETDSNNASNNLDEAAISMHCKKACYISNGLAKFELLK